MTTGTAPEVKITFDGQVLRRTSGTENWTNRSPVTQELWTMETALAWTVEDEAQFLSDYEAEIQDALGQPPPASTNPFREETSDIVISGGETVIEYDLYENSVCFGISMAIIEPVVTDGTNTFEIFRSINAVDTLIGNQDTTILSDVQVIAAGSNPKLKFVPNGAQFVSGAIRIRKHWFQPFPILGG